MGKEVQAILNLLSEGVIVEGIFKRQGIYGLTARLSGQFILTGVWFSGLLLVLREKSILRILTCSGTWRGI